MYSGHFDVGVRQVGHVGVRQVGHSSKGSANSECHRAHVLIYCKLIDLICQSLLHNDLWYINLRRDFFVFFHYMFDGVSLFGFVLAVNEAGHLVVRLYIAFVVVANAVNLGYWSQAAIVKFVDVSGVSDRDC
jgi:hypothetical protein